MIELIEHIDEVMKKLDDVCSQLADGLCEYTPVFVQDKIMNGYDEPHGADGHTEIYDTGRLHDSIQAKSYDVGHEHTCDTGTDVEYAGYVHNGTYKLGARPYIRDAIDDNKGEIEEYCSRGLAEGMA